MENIYIYRNIETKIEINKNHSKTHEALLCHGLLTVDIDAQIFLHILLLLDHAMS